MPIRIFKASPPSRFIPDIPKKPEETIEVGKKSSKKMARNKVKKAAGKSMSKTKARAPKRQAAQKMNADRQSMARKDFSELFMNTKASAAPSPAAAPPSMSAPAQKAAEEICCQKFNPAPYQEKEFVFKDKIFVKDRVSSLMHVPLNFGEVAVRNFKKIKEAGAEVKDGPAMLVDENSAWGADVYFAASKNIAGANAVAMSGTFLAKVFEGAYSDIPRWMEQMAVLAKARNKKITHFLYYYPTCPKCSKKYGHNYVVIFAQVE